MPGLDALLKPIAHFPGIKKIFPGEWHNTKSHITPHLVIQNLTPNGVYLLARGLEGVQKVFITSQDPKDLRQRLEAQGFCRPSKPKDSSTSPAET